MKNLKADSFLEMPAAIPHRIFRLNVAFQKSKDKNTQRRNFIYCFVWVWEAWSVTVTEDVYEQNAKEDVWA